MGEQNLQQNGSRRPGENPFVSICIPARNSADCIGYTIENLLNQHYPRDCYEIIIANHASNDDTAGIVERYADRNIKIITVADGSRSRAYVRNRCLEQALGEIVIFIDSDILVCDAFIEEHLRAREHYPNSLIAGYVYGKSHVFGKDDGAGKKLHTSHITDHRQRLESSPEYKDSREFYACIDNANTDWQLITRNPDAWRISWSCNLSVRRRDLIDLGGFDESFTGWGLEDEELGYRFLQSGRDLIFAKKAWGYHAPHPANTRKNFAGFKHNLGYFFRKHPTATIELMHINFFPSRMMSILGYSTNFFPTPGEYATLIDNAAAKLGKSEGARLGVFMRHETDAQALDLDHCFIPGLPWDTAPYEKELAGKNRLFYSLLGLRTLFESNQVDETLVPVDLLMFVNESILSDILLETARISKKIILIQGEVANNPDNAATRKCFERAFSLIKTGEVVRVDA